MKVLTIDDVKAAYPWLANDIDNAPAQFPPAQVQTIVSLVEGYMLSFAGTVYNPLSITTLDQYAGLPFLTKTFFYSYTSLYFYLVHEATKKSILVDLRVGFMTPQIMVQEITKLAVA